MTQYAFQPSTPFVEYRVSASELEKRLGRLLSIHDWIGIGELLESIIKREYQEINPDAEAVLIDTLLPELIEAKYGIARADLEECMLLNRYVSDINKKDWSNYKFINLIIIATIFLNMHMRTENWPANDLHASSHFFYKFSRRQAEILEDWSRRTRKWSALELAQQEVVSLRALLVARDQEITESRAEVTKLQNDLQLEREKILYLENEKLANVRAMEAEIEDCRRRAASDGVPPDLLEEQIAFIREHYRMRG